MRYDAESLLSFNAVGLKIVVINGENRGERLFASQVNKRGIGEVHWPIAIAVHEDFDLGEIVVIDGQDAHRSRAEKTPNSPELMRTVHQVEELCEYRCGGSQR